MQIKINTFKKKKKNSIAKKRKAWRKMKEPFLITVNQLILLDKNVVNMMQIIFQENC